MATKQNPPVQPTMKAKPLYPELNKIPTKPIKVAALIQSAAVAIPLKIAGTLRPAM